MRGSNMKPTYLTPKKSALAVLLIGSVLTGGALQAQSPSMEERLRSELRTTAQQLQRLQSEQAQLTVAKQSAESQRDALQAELDTLKKDLARAQSRSETLAEQQEQLRQEANSRLSATHQQLNEAKTAYDSLATQARQLETQGQTLSQNLQQREHELQVCSLKNDQLYSAGREILRAYESFSTADLLALRQPFASSARVAFDMKAQEMGDALYEQKFDSRAVQTPEVTP